MMLATTTTTCARATTPTQQHHRRTTMTVTPVASMSARATLGGGASARFLAPSARGAALARSRGVTRAAPTVRAAATEVRAMGKNWSVVRRARARVIDRRSGARACAVIRGRPLGANPERRGVATAFAREASSTTRASRPRARNVDVVLCRSRRRARGRDARSGETGRARNVIRGGDVPTSGRVWVLSATKRREGRRMTVEGCAKATVRRVYV